MKRKAVYGLVLLMLLVAVPVATAQYGDGSWYTSYQIQNLGTSQAGVSVTYYDGTGAAYAGPSWNIDGGSSVVWTQFDDTSLPPGQYSAVIESSEEIATVVNQQLLPNGATAFTPIAPFSSYGGFTGGADEVILPSIMHNWFGYYTEFFVQNVGSGPADVDITYIPGVMESETAGASGVTDSATIPVFASESFSQEELTALGAPSGAWSGRFLGSAVVTSDEPIAVVVNQHQVPQRKLFTYNGFAEGADSVAAPTYMRGHYGYYASLTIANPSSTADAHVDIAYTADNTYSAPASLQGDTVNAGPFTISPGTALVRYDGPGASDAQSDLDDDPQAFTRFFGAVQVDSDIPVVVMVNQEATSAAGAQAGTYNGAPLSEATVRVSAPLIQADFYGYYTSLTIQNTTGDPANITIYYTSDGTYSAVKNATKSYPHTIPANGSVNIYEGRKGGVEIGDINSDSFWRDGTNMRFMGSAIIESDKAIIAYVNEEKNVSGMDSMYSFNAVNLTAP
jgi:hypothetical protein